MYSKRGKWLHLLLLVAMLVPSACAQATPAPTAVAQVPAQPTQAGVQPTQAAAQPTQSSIAALGPVSISFVTHDFEPWRNTMLQWTEDYMTMYPNVKISYVTYPMTDMVTKLVTGFESGTGDTVMGIYGPWLAELAAGGYLDEAPPWVMDMLKEDFYPIAIDAASYNGKLYGVIQHVGTPLPTINVALYQAAGISESDYPKTFDQLVAQIPKLDKKDAKGAWQNQAICLPTMDVFTIIDWSTVLFAYGGRILNESMTKAAFNTPEGLAATQVYKKIHYKDADPNLFPAGKCAMWWYGSWSRPMITAVSPNMQVKVLEPLAGPVKKVHANYVWSWVVNSHATSAQKQVAWDFIKYITRPGAQIVFWNVVHVMPTRKSVYTDPSIKNDTYLQAFGQYVNETEVYYPPLPNWEPVEKALIRDLQNLISGQVSEQQFLDQAEKDVNGILAGG
jgi:ABC-type glycerol-3-phosphate transport system substrate-binding protein